MYYDRDHGMLMVWNGSAWTSVCPAAVGGDAGGGEEKGTLIVKVYRRDFWGRLRRLYADIYVDGKRVVHSWRWEGEVSAGAHHITVQSTCGTRGKTVSVSPGGETEVKIVFTRC